MQKTVSPTQPTTIGCKLPFNPQDFQCSIIFPKDNPTSGTFSYLYEDRPPQYACLSSHRHSTCGSSYNCDENSHSVDFDEPTPKYYIFCRECCEKIKRGWKFDGLGNMVTTKMTDEVRIRREGEATVRRIEAEGKRRVRVERRAIRLKDGKK
jgi:hypothetical protein